ncbi:hypothetical protein P8452_07473 [Trifolium repens]|nr:hypothetical protein P8452_07473 [Trifolium repens]
MDAGDEEEAEGDDGGMSVDVGDQWVFLGHEPAEFPKGPSYKGHDHRASPITLVAHGKLAKNEVQKNLMTNQHAYPIAPVAQGKIPRNRVQKNSTNNEQASPKKILQEKYFGRHVANFA